MGDIMLNNLRSYILETDFKITILKNQINVVNYTSLGHFDEKQIILYHDQNILIIKGEALSVTKLLNDEILIVGKIKTIEFR